jgi:hypothetical protein
MKRVVWLLVAAVILGSCGGSAARLSKSAYEKELRAALGRPLLVEHSPPQAAVDSLDGVVARFDDIASRLSGLRTPPDAQTANDRLVAGATRFSSTLRALVKRLRGAAPDERNRMLAEFDADHIPGMAEFQRATAVLAAKGYRFSSNGGT